MVTRKTLTTENWMTKTYPLWLSEWRKKIKLLSLKILNCNRKKRSRQIEAIDLARELEKDVVK